MSKGLLPKGRRAALRLGFLLATGALAVGFSQGHDVLIVTSTNAQTNNLVVFRLNTGAPSLSMVSLTPTGGAGGAGGNAGAVQFLGNSGAVVNYGSNTVSELVRTGDSIRVARTVNLAPGCSKPVSVALARNQAFVVGANCAESHSWPSGGVDGPVVPIGDASAGQIVVGETWAAVTLKSGSVLQLPLSGMGTLSGSAATVALPAGANDTPLGAAFWKNILGFNPAHSPNSFALVNENRTVFPVLGPAPAYPGNAPCWLAKGPGNIWYSGNSPGQAISIFFSDGQGGSFYKSVPLPGVPTDITVSADGSLLAVIFTGADGNARVRVFAIDAYGDLSPLATSDPIGVSSFNGVAISR
jgi:hypothetical protein